MQTRLGVYGGARPPYGSFTGKVEAEVPEADDTVTGGWLDPEQAESMRQRLKALREVQDATREAKEAARLEFIQTITDALDGPPEAAPEIIEKAAKTVEKEAAKALTIDRAIDLSPILDQLQKIDLSLRLRERLRQDDEILMILLLAA